MFARISFAFFVWCLCLGAAVPVRAAAEGQNPWVLYGADGRREAHHIHDARLREAARATVALVAGWVLKKNGEAYDILAPSAGRAFGLCATERFVAQPSAAYCSGALIGPNLVVTAGHCLPRAQDCARTAFVFDFRVPKGRNTVSKIPASSVYSCQSLVHSESGPGGDFAIVRLNRPVSGRKPLALRSGRAPAIGTPVALLGHPMGVPLKYADGAMVRDREGPFLVAGLDAYAGNSGSPVINPRTYRIEGILSRGEEDFDLRGVCFISRKCSNRGCSGEEATDVSQIRRRLRTLTESP